MRFKVGQQRTETTNKMRTMQGLKMSTRYVLFLLSYFYFTLIIRNMQNGLKRPYISCHVINTTNDILCQHTTTITIKSPLSLAPNNGSWWHEQQEVPICPTCHHEITRKHSSSSAEGKKGLKTTSSACSSHLLTMKSLLLTMVTKKMDSGWLVIFFLLLFYYTDEFTIHLNFWIDLHHHFGPSLFYFILFLSFFYFYALLYCIWSPSTPP